MSYSAITEKLRFNKTKYITKDEIEVFCKKLNLNYRDVISYLIHNYYLITLLKEIFYIPDLNERKNKSIHTYYPELIKTALTMKGIKNWYFGLETALKYNNATHEYFTIVYVINDTIFRKNLMEIGGVKVKFIKLKKELFTFGIIKKPVNYSDLEKTLLDKIYLYSYNSNDYNKIKYNILEYIDVANERKLRSYVKYYSKPVKKILLELLDDRQ